MEKKDIELDSEGELSGDDPEEWVSVATTLGKSNATIIAGRLESHGILTRVTQEAAGISVFPVNVGILAEAHVWVQKESVALAQEILSSDLDEEEQV